MSRGRVKNSNLAWDIKKHSEEMNEMSWEIENTYMSNTPLHLGNE